MAQSPKADEKSFALSPKLAGEFRSNSLLYREVMEEREEILRHKWYLSERAGHDVGIYETMADWVANHRAAWICAWRTKNNPPRT
ncbi:MAG: DUF4032 domain-containing protein [Opitutales bacterium]|nr:DUF4032 domain-containing protein [Opitutales bacterium]